MSAPMIIRSTDICLIAGKRGSGKTTLTKSLADTASRSEDFTRNQVLIRKIDPLMDLGGELVRDRDEYNKVLKAAFTRKDTFLVTDESDKFFPNKQTLSYYEQEFIDRGRHWGLGGIFVTRRLSKLHTDLVSQCNKLFIFRLFAKADAMYLEGCGFGEFIPIIWNLGRYEFLVCDLDEGNYYVSPPI